MARENLIFICPIRGTLGILYEQYVRGWCRDEGTIQSYKNSPSSFIH